VLHPGGRELVAEGAASELGGDAPELAVRRGASQAMSRKRQVRVGVAPLDPAASGRRVTALVRRPGERCERCEAVTGARDRERQLTPTREVVSP